MDAGTLHKHVFFLHKDADNLHKDAGFKHKTAGFNHKNAGFRHHYLMLLWHLLIATEASRTSQKCLMTTGTEYGPLPCFKGSDVCFRVLTLNLNPKPQNPKP